MRSGEPGPMIVALISGMSGACGPSPGPAGSLVAEACRSCGAPVLWCRTEAGKMMPVDAEPVENGNLEVIRAGDRLIARVRGEDLLGSHRYLSHFVTCPQSREWRAPAQAHSPESKAAATAIEPKIGRRGLADAFWVVSSGEGTT